MKILAANWWALALRGLLGVAFGIFAFVYPAVAIASLVFTFAAYMLVSGVFSLLAASRGANGDRSWWALRIQGIAGIGAGIAALVDPALTAYVLLYVIAGWALLTGVLELVAAATLRRRVAGEWLMLFQGAASVMFAVLVMAAPAAGALAVVLVIGTYAFVSGIALLVLAFRLRETGAPTPVVHRAMRRAA